MSTPTNSPRTKVAQCIEKYELDEMGATLEAAWTGQDGERTSLRDLAAQFNRTLTETALHDAGTRPLTVDVDGLYTALQSGSEAEQLRATRRLEREGIDVDELTADFVTHQAMHNYLTSDRDASLPASDTDSTAKRIETLEKLVGRVSAIAESTVDFVSDSAGSEDATYEVLVDVRTVCTVCGQSYSIRELLEQDGCQCQRDA